MIVTLLGGLRSVTGSAWLAAPAMLCNRRCLRPRWLSQERSRATVNSCSMYSCVTFSLSLFGPFFHLFPVSFLFSCISFCMVHPDLFSQLFCTLHLHKSHSGELGIVHKKLTSDVTVKWGHCFILWHATRIAWITRQIYCLKSLLLAQIQKKRNSSKLILGSE